MFAGMPNMDSFIKNMSINPYLEPDRIIYAVELDVNKKELSNYKIRPLSDETILYEGYCTLPKDRTRTVEMVADLKRDDKGNPIGIEFRTRTEKEIEESPDKYIPSEDYINFVNEQKKQFGFAQGDGRISNLYNNISNVMAGGKLEYNEVVRSTKKNFLTIIKEFISKFKNRNKPRLPAGNIEKNYSDKPRKIDDIKVDDEIKEAIELKRKEYLENENKNNKDIESKKERED